MINTPQRWMSRAFTLFFLNVLVLTLGLSNLWARPAGPKVSLRGVPVINTIAGNGIGGGTGDGAAAAAAELQYPSGVTLDRAGNIYIADSENYAVRVVNTQRTAITVAGISIQPGDIATVAGTLGTSGNSGNGGAATSAQIGWVNGIAVDGNGNIYIADESNSFVRKISSSGVITIVAGNGLCSNGTGQDGDGGPATLATVGCGYGVAVDASGNLFLSDTSAGRIREVNTQGIISTIAGSGSEGDGCGSTGSTGDGGPADQSTLGCPLGVHVDSNGNPYFADYFGQTVRYINLQNVAITVAGITIQPGDIDRIAGNQTPGYSGDGGPAVSAELYYPWDVVIDARNAFAKS
jgi:hypothetical protein